MLAAAVVRSVSTSAVGAQVLAHQEPAVLADLLLAPAGLVPVPAPPEFPAQALQVLLPVPPEPGGLDQVLAVLPQLAVEPEVLVHLRSRPSFSAAMASSSPPPEKPTYERVPRSR
jgi:hypothetical protein